MRNLSVAGSLYLTTALLYALSQMYGGFGPWFLFGVAALLSVYETAVLIFLPRRFAVERKLSALRVRAQEDVRVALTVCARDRRLPTPVWLRVEELLPARLAVRCAQPRWLAFLGRGGMSTFNYALSGVPRGVFDGWAAQITCGDAFGLIVRRTQVSGAGQLVVYPASCPPLHLFVLDQVRLGARVVHARSSDDASRAAGVRDYVPGDRLSRIHWPATARSGALRSKEFEHYTTTEIVLVIDASEPSFGGAAASFERALSVAASIVQYAHREGLSFGLVTFARRFIDHGIGKGDVVLVQSLGHLAALEIQGDEGPGDSPWRLLGIPGQAVVLLIARRPERKLLRLAVMLREKRCRVTLLAVQATEAVFTGEEEEAAVQLRALGWRVERICDPGDLESTVRLPPAEGGSVSYASYRGGVVPGGGAMDADHA